MRKSGKDTTPEWDGYGGRGGIGMGEWKRNVTR